MYGELHMTDFLNKFSLEGKNALIICPENPYGYEITRGLSEAGANIWLAGCREEADIWEEVHNDLKIEGTFIYEHGSAASAAQLEQEVREKMGAVDILVENGLYTPVSGWNQSYEQIYDQMEKTHLGMMLTVQSLGHILAEQGHGSVILVSDYGALAGYDPWNYGECPEQAERDFSLVKGFIAGGVVNYARQASNYLAEHGCRCNAIAFGPMQGTYPEAFEQAFIRHSQVKRMINPQDIAAAAVFLASDASAFITGITLPVDGGYTAK